MAMALTLADATKIATEALQAGQAEGAATLCVVVTEPGGCLRVAMRSDGAGLFGIDIALAKAVTALGFGRASSHMAKLFGGSPSVVTGLNGATSGRFLPLAGGVLILDADGTLIGATGVAGSLPENDERFALAGIMAAGLSSPG